MVFPRLLSVSSAAPNATFCLVRLATCSGEVPVPGSASWTGGCFCFPVGLGIVVVVVAAREFGDSFRGLCFGDKPSLAVLVRIGMNLLYFKSLNHQRRRWGAKLSVLMEIEALPSLIQCLMDALNQCLDVVFTDGDREGP